MTLIAIRFQTSALVPAPYAHAIEFTAEAAFNYKLERNYLDRAELSEDEIFEEGFSLDDDLVLEGSLPNIWKEAVLDLISNSKRLFLKEFTDEQDFWEIVYENETFYPINARKWSVFLQELQQATLEQNKIEKPLEIKIKRKSDERDEIIELVGSFEKRELKQLIGEKSKNINWENLNDILKNVYSGEYLYEKAETQMPIKSGLFINLGDEYWFEVGKSLLIKPSKITSWIVD